MIPFGNETVTMVKRTEAVVNGKTRVSYSTVTLNGCSWRRSTRMMRSGEALLPVEGITCRIPAGQAKPQSGDLLILCEVAVTVTGGADYQSLIEKYRGDDGAFVVTSVKDNARPGVPLPHYAARGE